MILSLLTREMMMMPLVHIITTNTTTIHRRRRWGAVRVSASATDGQSKMMDGRRNDGEE